jgi:transcriptional regulator with XRE-family HTH domain
VDRLAELRESQGLTLRDLADRSGVDANTINQVELGHRKPRPSTLRKLAKALEVDVADFFREPVVPLADEAPRKAGPTADPHEWAQDYSARLHGMSDEEWAAHIRELESVGEIKQEFLTLLDEAKGLHLAYNSNRWLYPENQENRTRLARRLREIRTVRLADLANAAKKKKAEALARHVMEALLEEAPLEEAHS